MKCGASIPRATSDVVAPPGPATAEPPRIGQTASEHPPLRDLSAAADYLTSRSRVQASAGVMFFVATLAVIVALFVDRGYWGDVVAFAGLGFWTTFRPHQPAVPIFGLIVMGNLAF